MRNVTYLDLKPHFDKWVPSYIIQVLDKIGKGHEQTRSILRKELHAHAQEVKEQLETIQINLVEIGLNVSMTKIVQGEFEIAIPVGPFTKFKGHLYVGDVDLTQIAKARLAISIKVDQIIEEMKEKYYETYSKLLSVKEKLVEGILGVLKKAKRKRL